MNWPTKIGQLMPNRKENMASILEKSQVKMLVL
uniref:Uncharacterized protein n=1 Tax=Arundo donax TaxID=35708 RepID=A0A0A9BKE5_ARUDO